MKQLNQKRNKRLVGTACVLLSIFLMTMPLLGMAADTESGNEALACICDIKCAAETTNQEWPVCKDNVDSCQGTEAEPAEPESSVEPETPAKPETPTEPESPVEPEKPTEPETPAESETPTEPENPTKPETPAEPEKCVCTGKCAAGAVNTACPICKNDLAKCEGTEPEVLDPKFTISILAPDGWYTNRASVGVRIKDVNGTGWETVEAKINSGGSWIDLTDDLADKSKTTLDISENCTVYVTVTDRNGKSHTKNRYIEVFDRESPTVRAGIDGELLRVEASDDLSGVDKIYVCGNSFSNLNNGTLDIRLKDYADNYEKITIQAVDNAGNKSSMPQLNNPYYEAPKKDSTETSGSTTTPTAATSSAGTTETTAQQTGNAGQTAKPTSSGFVTEKDPSAVSPTATEEENPLTPDGSATVVDNATDEQGKEFYTIMTPDENVFYLIIDKQRDSDNVYFLNAVTESDLMTLAVKDSELAEVTPAKPEETESAAPTEPEEPAEPETPAEEPEQPAAQSNTGTMFLLIVIVLAAGGLGYYFKIYKPKHELDDAEDIDEFEFEGPEEPAVNEDEPDGGEIPYEELSEEEEAEQRRLYEEDNEDIPIEGDDDLVF